MYGNFGLDAHPEPELRYERAHEFIDVVKGIEDFWCALVKLPAILVFAPIDKMVRISLRQEAFEVPPQDIITRDNVTTLYGRTDESRSFRPMAASES